MSRFPIAACTVSAWPASTGGGGVGQDHGCPEREAGTSRPTTASAVRASMVSVCPTTAARPASATLRFLDEAVHGVVGPGRQRQGTPTRKLGLGNRQISICRPSDNSSSLLHQPDEGRVADAHQVTASAARPEGGRPPRPASPANQLRRLVSVTRPMTSRPPLPAACAGSS